MGDRAESLRRRLSRMLRPLLDSNTRLDDLEHGGFSEPLTAIVTGEFHWRAGIEAAIGDANPPLVVPVRFERDPANEHDPNAIAAFVGEHQVGFLAREIAATTAPVMDRHGVTSFTLAGKIDVVEDTFYVDVWADRRITRGPRLSIPTSFVRSLDWRQDPITDRQIAFILDLVARWNPHSPHCYEEATEETHREVMRRTGLPELTERRLRSLTKGEGSDIIDRLLEWESDA